MGTSFLNHNHACVVRWLKSLLAALAVCLPLTGWTQAFFESGGLVVMAADHYQSDTPASGYAWIPTNDVPGFVSPAAMCSVPKTGVTISTTTNSPLMTYSIQLTNSGSAKLWIRGYGATSSEDAVEVGVDGQSPKEITYSPVAAWTWKSASFTITNSGPHQINVWMRKSGAYVDRVVLSMVSSFTPTNGGPAETGFSVQVTSPAPGSTLPAGSTIPVTAGVLSGTSPIAAVSFYVNGTQAAVVTSAPYSFAWTPLEGAYQLSAIAVDNFGNTATSAPVNVTVGPFTVRMTSPAQGSSFPANTTVSLAATVANVGPVTMNFYANGARIATTTNAPYTFAWTPKVGSYQLSAIAVDNLGESAPSAPVNVTVGPMAVQITSPPSGSGARIDATVPVSASVGNVAGPVSVSFYVNGTLAVTETNAPYGFVWSPPAIASYQISAIATDSLGDSSASAVSVTITDRPPATLSYSPSSHTIYVGGGGKTTLTQIAAGLPNAPLALVDTANLVWYLGATIVVREGAILLLHGTNVGGDVNELHLKSDNIVGGTNNYVWLDADWGKLDINGVKIISWNDASNGPAIEPESVPRAFIRARSQLSGTNALESTLDVVNSEIGWLGYINSESYALTWEVISNTPGVDVFGAVTNSYIHDCQLGAGTWTGSDVNWTGDLIVSNTLYGLNANNPNVRVVLGNNIFRGNLFGATFDWASSSRRIYVSGPGSATLSDIKAALPSVPLCLLDPTNDIWFLGASIILTNGASLLVHGTAVGGDANQVLMKSDNVGDTNNYVWMDADWGTFDFQNTKVISWNELAAAPDTNSAVYGRAYIAARSRLIGTNNIQQSTLNVVNSEIGWLGMGTADEFGLERYGLTWQVVGSAPGVLALGSVSNSYIHDCQVSVADWFNNTKVYGSQVAWSGNKVSGDTLYGFDPTDSGQKTVLAVNNVSGNSFAPILRWANVDQRIYVTGNGDATLSQIAANLRTAPLKLVDPTNMIWYLTANLWINNGAHLKLYGPSIGGDVGTLRIKSQHQLGSNGVVQLRADPGWIDIQNTIVTSWNSVSNGPDIITNIYTQYRSYVHARSTLDPDGHTAHQARMDVINSDIGYLGYHATEAYGLTWKVVDTTAKFIPAGSTNTLYDLVKVYGNIENSHIHNNCFGVYTFGDWGGIWTNNEVDHNLAYGFDPHNGSDYLDIENNNVHDNGWHGIIASVWCINGILRNNRSYHNGLDLTQGRANCIMLHRSCNNWIIENNLCYSNRDSGIAIFASNGEIVSNNYCAYNGLFAIRLSVGARNNLVVNNQVFNSYGNGIYMFPGTNVTYSPYENETFHFGQYYAYVGTNVYLADEPTVRCQFNVVSNNLVNGTGLSGTNAEALKVENSDSNLLTANLLIETNLVHVGTNFISTNAILSFIEGTNNIEDGNILPTNALTTLTSSNTFVITNIVITFTGKKYITNEYGYFVPAVSSSVQIANQRFTNVQLATNTAAIFTDLNGAIFVLNPTNLAAVETNVIPRSKYLVTNTVTPLGSTAIFANSSLRIGTNRGVDHILPVMKQDLSALPASGSASVLIDTWNTPNATNQTWIVTTPSPTTRINFRVGDLTPYASFVALLGSTLVGSDNSDSNGVMSFASSPGVTNPVAYSVVQVPTVTAAFVASRTSGGAPMAVQFTNLSSGQIASYYWNFGDGSSSGVQNPPHTYTHVGVYDAVLTVTGAYGQTNAASQIITVTNIPPVTAIFAAIPPSGPVPLAVQFTNTSTGPVVEWSWFFGDGSQSGLPNPSHTYTNAGTYSVLLTVTGGAGQVSSATHTVTATNIPPVLAAYTANPTSGISPLTVKFTDQSTGQIASQTWNFGDGTFSTVANPTHVYTNSSVYTVYTVQLSVLGGAGQTASTNHTITVTNIPPVTAIFSAGPNPAAVTAPVQFTDQSTGPVTNWSWSFGDGVKSTSQSPAHAYTNAGSFKVQLVVTGSLRQTNSMVQTITITNAPLVAAAFASSPTSGLAPLTVQFTDASTGPVAAWNWNFGDGSSSTLQNPSHTFAHAGNDTVQLTVIGTAGQQNTTQHTIISTNIPVFAGFTANPASGINPLTVQFTDRSTGPVASWNWSFGDGQTDTNQNPTHTFGAGTFTTWLVVIGNAGQSNAFSLTIISTNVPVSASFTATPASGLNPLTVQFTDQSSGPVVGWNWTFGDGTGSTLPSPAHTYAAGTFTARLVVVGNAGQTNSATTTITSTNIPVFAHFTSGPNSGLNPLTVQFTNLSTGPIVAWNWSFGDGGTDTNPSPTHTFAAGTFTTRLTVVGNAGQTNAATVKITSTNVPVAARFTSSPTSGLNPLTVQFTNQSVGPIVAWNWSFGDGTTSTLPSPTHTYAAGTFTARLEVVGNAGQSNGVTARITSTNVPVVARFTSSPTSGLNPLTVQFTSQSTGPIVSWNWSFGDGATSSLPSPTHTYAAGTFTTRLVVVGNAGQSNTASITITSTNVPVFASFTASPTSGMSPLTVQFTDASTGPIVSWNWSFGDGSTSTSATPADPSHTYSTVGTFTSRLVVVGNAGQTNAASQTITVTNVPVFAAFIASPSSGIVPLAVQFTDESTGPVVGWNWNFGDGITSTLQSPSHTYTVAGNFTARLTVTGSSGQTNVSTQPITVSP